MVGRKHAFFAAHAHFGRQVPVMPETDRECPQALPAVKERTNRIVVLRQAVLGGGRLRHEQPVTNHDVVRRLRRVPREARPEPARDLSFEHAEGQRVLKLKILRAPARLGEAKCDLHGPFIYSMSKRFRVNEVQRMFETLFFAVSCLVRSSTLPVFMSIIWC